MPNSIEQGIDIYQSFIAGRQNIQYYDIKDMDVLIEDTSAMSSQYFKIIKMPNQLEGGKNAFFLLGDSEMLEKNTEILIEVLDANGDNMAQIDYGINNMHKQLQMQEVVRDVLPYGCKKMQLLVLEKYMLQVLQQRLQVVNLLKEVLTQI